MIKASVNPVDVDNLLIELIYCMYVLVTLSWCNDQSLTQWWKVMYIYYTLIMYSLKYFVCKVFVLHSISEGNIILCLLHYIYLTASYWLLNFAKTIHTKPISSF